MGGSRERSQEKLGLGRVGGRSKDDNGGREGGGPAPSTVGIAYTGKGRYDSKEGVRPDLGP